MGAIRISPGAWPDAVLVISAKLATFWRGFWLSGGGLAATTLLVCSLGYKRTLADLIASPVYRNQL